MAIDEWKNSGNYFDYKGFPIFYKTSESENEVLLCLHGFPTASYDYHKVWSALSERFSLVAFDMIGYGFSDKPPEFDYTTFKQVDVLQALIEHLKIEKLHLLAHDYGNTITQELLARAEEDRVNFEIESICFLNGALFPETHRPILAQKTLAQSDRSFFSKIDSRRKVKQRLASVFGPEHEPTQRGTRRFYRAFPVQRRTEDRA